MFLHTAFAHNTPIVNWLIQRVFEDQWENGDPLVTFRLEKMEVVKGHMPRAYLGGEYVSLAMHMEAMPDISFTQSEGEEMMINFTARLDGKVVCSRAPLSSIVQIQDRSIKNGTNAHVYLAYQDGMTLAIMRKPKLSPGVHQHLFVQDLEDGAQVLPEHVKGDPYIPDAPDMVSEPFDNAELGLEIIEEPKPVATVPHILVRPSENLDRLLGHLALSPEEEGETVYDRRDLAASLAPVLTDVRMTAGDPKRVIDYDTLQAGLASGKVVDLQAWKKSKRK